MEKEEKNIIPSIPENKKETDLKVVLPNKLKGKMDSEIQHLLNSPISPNNNGNMFIFNNDSNNLNNNKIDEKKENSESPKQESEEFNIDRKGNMLMFFFNKKGVPLIVLGPNWKFALIVFMTIEIISFCYFFFLWNLLFKYIRFIGLIIVPSQNLVYLINILMNPGIPTKDLYLSIFIQDTNHLEYLAVSEALYEIIKEAPEIEAVSEPFELKFDENGVLMNRWSGGMLEI